ncbi:allantoate amidohydrolase [Demequina zhanjiangensis]|uniref:Allantoate amidohydrolase n=1 Tax=Demequina zhanjiangensis TaxID=3051659 RepID=A0ABT8FY40_9MICO|nr:allantoate amidohydrolase [Demequina sp. SYSU T00b26]MDN4471824.1 allantoate amidohydrolase [Demequina sp. SYSU T00b26]
MNIPPYASPGMAPVTVPSPDETDLVVPFSAEEVLERCDILATHSSRIGAIERSYLTVEHSRTNWTVGEWMAQAGLEPWQDAAGNQRGSLAGPTDDAPVLLLASHLDTVPGAGRYDGILGTLMAIAVVGRLEAKGITLPFGVEVLGFADEEGTRFGRTLLGSCAVAGAWQDSWWELRDPQGISLRTAFEAFGLDPERIEDAALPREKVIGYLEAHIEQGPLLEDADRALGVVTGIMGARRFDLTMVGEAGHAGGMPYGRRRDALLGASELVSAIEELSRDNGAIGTVGRMQAYPGAANVIPGRADFSLDLRAETDELRDRVWDLIQEQADKIAAARNLSFEAIERHDAEATVVGDRLAQAIRTGIASTGDHEPLELLSKAGHDAMAIASLTDYAMLFIRCGGGISHHKDESVIVEDVALALDAFEAAVLDLARDFA